MNSIKNTGWVILLTFLLGYVVSTATAGRETGPHPSATPADGLRPIADAFAAAPADTTWRHATVASSMPERFSGTKANVINRADSLSRVFDVLCHSHRPLRVLQLGDSHVAGKSFPQAVKESLNKALAEATTDSAALPVDYSFIGSNGATTVRFATSSYMQRVAEKQPDLIILSFGTNECHGMGYREEVHREQLTKFLSMLRETCPDAVILLTTPPGDYLTSTSVTYVRRSRKGRRRRVVRSYKKANPMSTRCAALLEDFGKENGLPVWDLNTIAGGTDAVRNWTASGLMRNDRIHFTPEGYTLHGRLLAEALLTAYNAYLDNRTATTD